MQALRAARSQERDGGLAFLDQVLTSPLATTPIQSAGLRTAHRSGKRCLHLTEQVRALAVKKPLKDLGGNLVSIEAGADPTGRYIAKVGRGKDLPLRLGPPLSD